MLVNDDEAIGGCGKDIGIVELCQRSQLEDVEGQNRRMLDHIALSVSDY